MSKVLITGVSSGLGAALAKRVLERQDYLYAIGRYDNESLKKHDRYSFLCANLSELESIPERIKEFVQDESFDLVILNAGILGNLCEMERLSLNEIRRVMDLNVWANKQIIDVLGRYANVSQIVAVSSGAAVNGSKGWGAYSISKAALNMMIKLYAAERPKTHFSAIAPGVIYTPMLKKILQRDDEERFPSIRRIKDGEILEPDPAAKRFLAACKKALEYPSGSFLDVRKIDL